MAIIPTARCRSMKASLAFYTKVMDFVCLEDGSDDPDPTFSVLLREGDLLFLSSHGGDGEYGQCIAVLTDNVDAVFRKYRSRGLKTPGNPEAPSAVHEGQTYKFCCKGCAGKFAKDPEKYVAKLKEQAPAPAK